MPNSLNLPTGPTLETKRLILRPPIAEDFAGFCAFQADEKAMQHLGGVTTSALAWRVMRMVAGAWALDGFHMFSVILKDTGQWIGRVGPLFPEGWPEREVGWGLLSDYWGQGYACEAACASMDFAFDVLDWPQVVHTIVVENEPSKALAKRLGSTYLGPCQLPEPYGHIVCELWGQTRAQWKAQKL